MNRKSMYWSLSPFFILTLGLVLLFQNCGLDANHFSVSLVPQDNPLVSKNGNGVSYEGKKIPRYDFMIGIGNSTPPLHSTASVPPYKLNRELPKGLLFDAKAGVIYGTALEVTGDYWLYEIEASSRLDGGPLVQEFLLGVGAVFVVNAPMETTFEPDRDLTDFLCSTSNDDCSLKAAIQQANFNEVRSRILLPKGHFKLRTFPLEINRRMEIWGEGPEHTLLDGEDQVRVMNVVTDHFELRNLSLIRGRVIDEPPVGYTGPPYPYDPKANGACLRLDVPEGTSSTFRPEQNLLGSHIRNVHFKDCYLKSGYYGGAGLFSSYYNLVIEDSYFENNTLASGGGGNIGGGAVYTRGPASIIRSRFVNNRDIWWSGGAIKFDGSIRVAIRESSFLKNTARYQGGAIELSRVRETTISDSTFIENAASGPFGSESGGAIYYDFYPFDQKLFLSGSSFLRNFSSGRGSAVGTPHFLSSHFTHPMEISDSHFEGNRSVASQGAVQVGPYNHLSIKDSSFRNNVGGNCFQTKIQYNLNQDDFHEVQGTLISDNVVVEGGDPCQQP